MAHEKINPIDVQAYLNGIDYPANREELASHARDQGADDLVIDALSELPDKEYKTPAEVNEEVGALAGDAEDEGEESESEME
jgi:hypothetical protein